MEAESHIFGKQKWGCVMNQTLSQSVRQDIMLMASNSLHRPQPQRSKMIMPMLSHKGFATNSLN